MPPLPPGVSEHFPDDAGQLTPLFRQYIEIKSQYPQALLLYRLGDFYEMFGPDAVRAAEILGLTLTSRACGKDYKVAMCGVPHHSAVRYIKRLVTAGEVLALCEQTEDPALAKGLVERAVLRVITAGTLIEDEYLSEDSGNYLAVAAQQGSGKSARFGVALLESSGGRVDLFELPADGGAQLRTVLREALLRQRPAELLLPTELLREPQFAELSRPGAMPACHGYDALPGAGEIEAFLLRYFDTASLAAFGLAQAPTAQAALFALIRYLRATFKAGRLNLSPRFVPLAGELYLDQRAIACLELLEGLDPQSPAAGGKASGLYGLLNRCHTAGGRRELQRLLLAPSAERAVIHARHDAVQYLMETREAAQELATLLAQIQDVERIANRVCLGRTHPKELRALAACLLPLASVGALLRALPDAVPTALLYSLGQQIGEHSALRLRLSSTLADDPPLRISGGGVIRSGVDSRVDELRGLAGDGAQWFVNYEQRERERTGIRTLRVKQTGAFGYFIEVSKASAALVPDDYQRRQTLVNAERFSTPELARREADAKSAEAKLLARETELFEELCQAVAQQAVALAASARALSMLDVLHGLAEVAQELGWVRPELTDVEGEGRSRLEISAGRHPLVEQAVGTRYYIPNDCWLDGERQQIMVLTGPNMGGKSTYLRMVAVLCVLSQCGSFVPAQRAVLPVLSRIYTRVGAQDYVSRGQSTFMVEMLETAEILNTCGPGSLVILDEVGRGTSTYDGISIAKAVVEHLHELPARPLTLFATHFFELTSLEQTLTRVRNFQVEVARDSAGGEAGQGRFVFLYRVSPGAASDSFGIEVAALAGLPESVLKRARQVLAELEEVKLDARQRAQRAMQLGLFGEKKE